MGVLTWFLGVMTQLELLAMAQFLAMTGLWENGPLLNNLCHYLTRNFFPLVETASLWGHTWATKRVEFCSDNMAVVSVLSSGPSKDPNLMVLLRYLSLVAARNSFAFTASYTPGRGNSIADALSRFDFQRFHHLASHAAPMATPIPPSLLAQLLVTWLKSANSI